MRPELEHVSSWDFAREIQPGVYVHDDYDLERPSVELQDAQGAAAQLLAERLRDLRLSRGLRAEAGRRAVRGGADRRARQPVRDRAGGRPTPRGSRVGSLFTLEDCPRDDQNREYLIVAASYDLEFSDYEAMPEGAGTSYRCSFVAMSSAQQFRPRRPTPKPFVQGPQTAVVVGPAGEEIYTDKYGRVKVQFHWDRYGKKDENSSCWIRVSQPWAGKGWGVGLDAAHRPGGDRRFPRRRSRPADHHRPRLQRREPAAVRIPGGRGAQRDQVEHAQGGGVQRDVDGRHGREGEDHHPRPVRHGHHRRARPDVDDPQQPHRRGRRRRFRDGGQQPDAARRQEPDDQYRCQPAGDRRRDETISIGGHRSEKVGGGEDVTVTGARTHTVTAAQATTIGLAEAHTVGGASAHSVGAAEAITVGAAQMVNIGAVQMINVGANQSTKVGAAQSTTVGAAQSTTVAAARTISVGAAQTVSVKANASMSIGADETRSVTGGRTTSVGKDDSTKVTKNYILDAGESITLKSGDASITMKKDGSIAIKGKNITITGSGKITVKADSDVVIKGSKVGVN